MKEANISNPNRQGTKNKKLSVKLCAPLCNSVVQPAIESYDRKDAKRECGDAEMRESDKAEMRKSG